MHKRGFTLAELLVVIAIIGILSGLGVPAISAVLRTVRRTACASNLRQVGLSALAYAEDWSGLLPAEGACGVQTVAKSPAWFVLLPPYLDDERVRVHSVFQCAAFRWGGPQAFDNATPKSFKMNSYLDAAKRPRHYRLGSIRGGREAEVVLFADAVAGETGMGQWGHLVGSGVSDERHPGAVNALCLDGHTQSSVRTPEDGRWSQALTWVPEGWAGGP